MVGCIACVKPNAYPWNSSLIQCGLPPAPPVQRIRPEKFEIQSENNKDESELKKVYLLSCLEITVEVII